MIKQCALCGLVVRLLDFRAECLGFAPWSSHRDLTFGQGILHVCVPLHKLVQTLLGFSKPAASGVIVCVYEVSIP